MGIELERPIITDRSYSYGFSNEGGVCGTIRLLKNISGLWLIQECRRIWAEQGEDLSFAEIAGLAGEAGPFAAMIDIDSPEFATPGDMPERIRAFCDRSGQAPPESKGSMARTILESLAAALPLGVRNAGGVDRQEIGDPATSWAGEPRTSC